LASHFSLQELLSRARRRELTHLVLDKTALAAVIALGGAIVILLTGTELLDWYWLVLLAVVSLGVGLYRLRHSIPSLYTLAQRIDRRMQLADALSTALYFGQHPDRDRQAVCDRQRQDAEVVAREVDLRQALPLTRSRYSLPAAGLAVVALGLFGVRYLVTGTMSLQPSLVAIAYDSFFGVKPLEAKNQGKGMRPKLDPSAASDSNDGKMQDKDNAPEDLNAPENQQNDEGQEPSQTPGKAESNGKGSDKGDAKGDQKNDKGSDKDSANQKDGKGDSKADDKNGDSKSGNDDSKGKDGGNPSLMDKIRDALSNLASKVKPQDGKQQQSGNNAKQGQQGDRPDKGEKSSQGKDQKPEEASTSADAEGDQGDQTDSDQASDSKKASDKQASADAKNGAGSQDGEKAIKEAQQLQAMGKISEVLGKRSANVTGEVMVEVGNSKQPLKTPWAQRQATHSEAGSEIHRDEVPLIYQQFVQQYFEEIRKPAPGAKAAPPAPAPAPGK
jgi:hypothetical protein